MNSYNNKDGTAVVKSVLYAVVISVWASVFHSHGDDIRKFIRWIKGGLGIIERQAYYIESHEFVLMSIGVFIFLTLYFHDEWKYASSYEKNGYPMEKIGYQCGGWSFFLFQICLIDNSIYVSIICGLLGVCIINIGILRALGMREFLKCRFIWENCIWAIALIVVCVLRYYNAPYCNFFLGVPLLIVVFRFVTSSGLPKELESGVRSCQDKRGAS